MGGIATLKTGFTIWNGEYCKYKIGKEKWKNI